jgi:hypothetical protein
VLESGAQQEDDPVTRETLMLPRGKSLAKRAPACRSPVRPSVSGCTLEAAKKRHPLFEVGQRQGEPEPRPRSTRESEGRIGAMTVGNGWHPDPPEQRRTPHEPKGKGVCPGRTAGRGPVLIRA